MGLVLLGAAAAEAQTERILVSNTAVGNDDTANTSGNDHAQLFHTGGHTGGYTLTKVRVNSADDEGDDFDVEVCEEDGSADEFPSTTASDCTALTAPSDFTAGLVLFTHAGLALSANTNYVVVIKQRGTGSVRLKSTTNIGEDTSLGLSGWSIKDKFYWKSGSTWMTKSGSNEALRIVVSGYEVAAVDTTPPVLLSATVEAGGDEIELVFDEAYSLDGVSTLPVAAFSVTAAGNSVTIGNRQFMRESDDTYKRLRLIGLSPAIRYGQTVVVSYSDPTTGDDTTAIEDAAGNDVASFTTGSGGVPAVINNLPLDTTPPALASATVEENGVTIELVFDEAYSLVSVAILSVAAFSVTADGNSVTIGNNQVVIESDDTYKRLRLIGLSPAIEYGQTVVVSYSDPTTGDDTTAIEDAVGNDVASFTTGSGGVPAVINNLPSTDATLSTLALSGVTLSPAFDADTETYTASVANSVATTTVTAMATDAGATVAFTPSTDADAVTSDHQVNLDVGATTITATVTAADGMTTKTYTVVVTRAAQTCTVPTGGIWGACLTAATISIGSNFPGLPLTGLGCRTTSCGDTSVLTSRDFSFGGKNYRIEAVDLRGGTLEFNLVTPNANTAAAEFSSVVLQVGTSSYSLASASFVANSEAFAWTNTGLSWSANDKVALQLTDLLASTNAPPAFSAATATRSVPENSPASTNVGAPVTATDGDNDPLAYSLEGTAAAAFEIVSTSGQIRTTAGETYDRETQSSYAVTVKADDGNGGTDTIAVTITLTNVIEPPGRPAAPSVSSGSTTSLSVMWTAPANTGPAIDTYDLRYRQGTSGSWTNGPQNVSGTNAMISGLTANTLYQVQVQATSGEGDSPWSPPGSGQTNTADNTEPTFSSQTASRSVAENSAAGTNVGAPVTATDGDNDPLTYTLYGTDAASFDIVSTSGQIQTTSGVTYDYETKSSYAVIVKAEDSPGGSDTIMVAITVTDVDESPPPGPEPVPTPGPEPVPTPALPLLGQLLLALGLAGAGARFMYRRPRVPPAA